jgi:hypothetical protein
MAINPAGVDMSPFRRLDLDEHQKFLLEQMHLPELIASNPQAQAQNMPWQNGQFTHVPDGTETQAKSLNVHARCRGMLLDRLGGIDGPMTLKAGDFLMCHAYWGLVYVFFVFGKREGVTKESTEVFPSDKLVAQLRMVMIA